MFNTLGTLHKTRCLQLPVHEAYTGIGGCDGSGGCIAVIVVVMVW